MRPSPAEIAASVREFRSSPDDYSPRRRAAEADLWAAIKDAFRPISDEEQKLLVKAATNLAFGMEVPL